MWWEVGSFKVGTYLPSLFVLPRILGKRDPLDLAVVGGAPITVHNGADFRLWQVRAHGNGRRGAKS
jgi:hypothetical protein